MEFRLPSFETVIEIHNIVIEMYGGLTGVPHPHYIEAAITRPKSYMQYDDNCDIHLVAAIILDALVRHHGFADGNKRTALIAMLMTYNLNGVKLNYGLHMNNKFEHLVLRVAKKKPSVYAIRNRLKKLILEFSSDR